MMILDDSSDSKNIFREILCSLNTEDGCIKVHSVIMDIPISFREAQMIVFKNDDQTTRMFEMSIHFLHLDISLHIETLKFLCCCLAHIVLLVSTNGAECFSLSYKLSN